MSAACIYIFCKYDDDGVSLMCLFCHFNAVDVVLLQQHYASLLLLILALLLLLLSSLILCIRVRPAFCNDDTQ